MAEFTVHIDTHPGLPASEEFLERVGDLLDASEALGPAVTLQVETGVVGSTFQVEASSVEEAANRAIEAFGTAVDRALAEIGESEALTGGTYVIHEEESIVDAIEVRREREPVPA